MGKDDLCLTPAKGSLLVTVLSACTAVFMPLILGVGEACAGLRIVQDKKGWLWGLKKKT